jgi:ribosomal protein S17
MTADAHVTDCPGTDTLSGEHTTRRRVVGRVVRDKMNTPVWVVIEGLIKHPRYGM